MSKRLLNARAIAMITIAIIALAAMTTTTQAEQPASYISIETLVPLQYLPISSHAIQLLAVDTIDTRAYIHERYKSSSKVEQVRDAIPRWGQSSKMDFDNDDYARGVIYSAIPGAVLIVLTLIIWLVWSFAACCCCKPKENQRFTKNQIRVPLFTGFVCALVVIAFAIIGLWATEEFHKQINGTNGIGTVTLDVLDHVDAFFGRLNTNLDVVSTETVQLAPAVDAKLQNFTDLGSDLPNILTDLRRFASNVAALDPIRVTQVDPPSGSPSTQTYPCNECQKIGSGMSSFANTLDSSASPIFNQVASTKQAAHNEVVDAVPQIQSAIQEARSQVDDVQRKSTEYHPKIVDRKRDVDHYESIRRAIVIVIFVLPIVICLLFFILTVFLRREGCTKVLVHLMFFLGFITWIVFLVHVPLSLLVADSCHYLDNTDVDLAGQTSLDSSITKAATACLARQDLLRALDITTELNFTETVKFPVVPKVEDLFNVSSIYALNNDIQSLNSSIFSSYDSSLKYDALEELNKLTYVAPFYDYFGFANISTCIPVKYTPNHNAVAQYKSAVRTALSAEDTFTQQLNSAKTNMTLIMNKFDSLLNKSNHLLTVDMPALESVIQPLLQSANNVLAQGSCSPLDEDYARMKSTICHDMIISISSMAMASFFCGVFLFGLNFSAWFLIYRLQHSEDVPLPNLDGVPMYMDMPSPDSRVKVQQGVIIASDAPMIYAPTTPSTELTNYQPVVGAI